MNPQMFTALMEAFSARLGFDACTSLVNMTNIIQKPFIKVNMLNSDNFYPFSYIEDTVSGEQFYVQFFATNLGDLACVTQVWSGMFRDVVLAGLPV